MFELQFNGFISDVLDVLKMGHFELLVEGFKSVDSEEIVSQFNFGFVVVYLIVVILFDGYFCDENTYCILLVDEGQMIFPGLLLFDLLNFLQFCYLFIDLH